MESIGRASITKTENIIAEKYFIIGDGKTVAPIEGHLVRIIDNGGGSRLSLKIIPYCRQVIIRHESVGIQTGQEFLAGNLEVLYWQ